MSTRKQKFFNIVVFLVIIPFSFFVFSLRQKNHNIARAAGTNYYVSTAGNDANPGTQTQPWRTIQKAANTMVAGDTANVLSGNYSTERVRVTKSGSLGAPITFQAQGTVQTKGYSIVNIVSNPYRMLPVDYITIRGFEIANTDYVRWHEEVSSGIYIKGSNNLVENNYIHDSALNGITLFGTPSEPTVTHDNTIRNNRLYHNEMVGINVSGRNNLIEGNEVWDSVQCHPAVMAAEGPGCPNYPAVSGLDADGMRFFGQGHTFKKNYIHDIKFGPTGIDPAIGDYNDDPHIDCFQTWAGTYNEAAANIVFEQNRCDMLVSQAANENGNGFMLAGGTNNLYIKNNIIKAYGGVNTGGGAHHLYIYNNLWVNNLSFNQFWPNAIALQSAPYARVLNNIFYDQPYHTIVAVGDTTGQEIDYNLAYNSDGSPPNCLRVGDYVCKTPTPPHDLWNIDPKFVNPGSGDYHLQSGSPAINTGITVSAVTNDLDGISRPQGAGFDIGAYEYSSDSSTITLTRTPTPGSSRTPTPIRTPTPTPTGIPGQLLGDGSGDCKVDGIDFVILFNHYGQTTSGGVGVGDFNIDGRVDGVDFVILFNHYGQVC